MQIEDLCMIMQRYHTFINSDFVFLAQEFFLYSIAAAISLCWIMSFISLLFLYLPMLQSAPLLCLTYHILQRDMLSSFGHFAHVVTPSVMYVKKMVSPGLKNSQQEK